MVKTFRVTFCGSLRNGPGRPCTFSEYVKAENKSAAIRQIYGNDKYQDVSKAEAHIYKRDTTSTWDGNNAMY